MIENWFISIFEISLFISPVILILVITAPFFNKHYTIKWKPSQIFTLNIPLQITAQATENTGLVPVLNTKASSTGITLAGIISIFYCQCPSLV